MVSLHFSDSNLNKSSIQNPYISGFVSGDNLILGIWEGKTLVEVLSTQLGHSKTFKSSLGINKVSGCNIIHASKLYEHVDYDSFEPIKINQYFGGRQAELKGLDVSYEKLKQQKVYTLSAYSKPSNSSLDSLELKTDYHHISTALANIAIDRKDQFLVLMMENEIHLVVHNNGKFQSYLQETVSSPNDYLYYLLLASKRLNISIKDMPVILGGAIDKSSPVYTQLKFYIPQLEFFSSSKYSIKGGTNPYHYYLPLILARACA